MSRNRISYCGTSYNETPLHVKYTCCLIKVETIKKIKAKSSLCPPKHHAMKTHPVLNQTPHHEHIAEMEVHLHAFPTSVPDGGGQPVLPPQKEPPIPTLYEVGRAPEPARTRRREEKPQPPPGIEPRSSSL
jgi:hypothetical protein